jgi:lysophospholipase L1-like esterase
LKVSTGRIRMLLLGMISAVLAVFVCVALAEVVLRLARDPDRYFPYYPNSRRVFYPSDEITPGVHDPSSFTTNSYGARGPELDGEPIRILTIGGSTTACTVLDDDETWPALLMRELNERAGERLFWVTNSAGDGQNSHHHLMHVKYFLPKLPEIDYVIVYLGLNDVGMWLYVADWDPNFLDDPDHWASRVGEAFRLSNYAPADDPWYKRFELWKRASILKARGITLLSERNGDAGPIVQDENLAWMLREQRRRANAEKRFVHRAKLETLPAALDSYARNLVQIAELIRAAGAEPIFMAQAMDHLLLDEEERKHWWMGAMDGGETYVNEEQMRELIQAFNARLREVAAAQSVLLVDLPTLLQGERGLFMDGHHFNEHGAAVTARRIADFLWPAVMRDAAARALH